MTAGQQRRNRVLGAVLDWLRARPWALALFRRGLALFPGLDRRAFRFAQERPRQYGQAEGPWVLAPEADALEAWRKRLVVSAD